MYFSNSSTTIGLDSASVNNDTTRLEVLTSSSLNYGEIMTVIPIGIVTVFLNSLVVIATVKFKRLQTFANRYLACLAASDLLWGLLAPGMWLTYEITPVMNASVCSFLVFFATFSMISSLAILLLVTRDRLLAVTKPVEYKLMMTIKRFVKHIVVCMLYSIFMSVFAQVQVLKNWKNGSSCLFDFIVWQWFAYYIVAHYIFALLYMLISYSFIVMSVRNHKRRIQTSSQNGLFFVTQLKATRMSAIIIGTSMTLLSPNMIHVILVNVMNQEYDMLNNIRAISVTLNSLVNPFIYVFQNQDFRICFKKLVCHSVFNRNDSSTPNITVVRT